MHFVARVCSRFSSSRRSLAALILRVWLLGNLGLAGQAQATVDAVFARMDGSVLAPQGAPNRLCSGDGAGNFTCVNATPANASFGVALGQINPGSDDYLDAVFANYGANRVCLSNSPGGFTCEDVSADTNWSWGVALGDIDGDGHIDAVFANSGLITPEPNRVCLGTGTGTFRCSDVSTDTNQSLRVALGHVNPDLDDHLDAVFANFDQRNRVCLGNGTGSFICDDVSSASDRSRDVALGFVDGDGHLDAVFADESFIGVCLGDGTGSFACNSIGIGAVNIEGVALGHLNPDTDGYLDAVFASDPGPTPANRACLGDGTGGFLCDSVGGSAMHKVALGFVDTNAHLDAVFSHSGAGQNLTCLGDGTGAFGCLPPFGEQKSSFDVALGAINVCGDTIVNPGEDCDDGNTEPNDCCTPSCQFGSSMSGTPDCCSSGVCQISLDCGPLCFTPGWVCMQPGGVGTPCACALP